MIVLRKKADRDFIILNLSDPQLVDEDWDLTCEKHKILTKTVSTLVESVHPDLITVSGDLACAGQKLGYRKLREFLDTFEIPWAFVLGNHDNQDGAEAVESVVQEYLESKFCLYERGPASLGNGNYVILITEEEKPVEAIIMMDSHDRFPFRDETGSIDTEAWAKLWPEQFTWYEEQVEQLRAQGCKESAIITHIPIYAYRQVFETAFANKSLPELVTPKQSYSKECWNPGYEDSFGVNYEPVSSYPEDEGAFKLIKRLGHTKTILCGHDHVNNWVITYQGVKFVYGLKTGPGCYWNEKLNGGTVLRITSEGVAEVKHIYVDYLAE